MTAEQRVAFAFMRRLAEPFRYRVKPDPEGWPVIPGRLGQIEWYDHQRVAVYSDRPVMFRRILAEPGVNLHQTGDKEIRALAWVHAFEPVATLIRARRRRVATAADLQKLKHPAMRATSEGQNGGAKA